MYAEIDNRFSRASTNERQKQKLLSFIIKTRHPLYAIRWAKEFQSHEDIMLDIVMSSKNPSTLLEWAKEINTHLDEIGVKITEMRQYESLYDWCRLYKTNIEENAHTIFIKNTNTTKKYAMIKKWLTNINYINYEIAETLFKFSPTQYLNLPKYFNIIYPILTIEKTNESIEYTKKYIYNQLITNNILDDYYTYLENNFKSYQNIIRKTLKDLDAEAQLGIVL